MQSHIRNFCIIAHIDHGKSTLADRLLEITGTVEKRDMQAQLLDSNPIERERGITIKLAPVRMIFRPAKILNSEYILNLIDTPGHVDFSYEVSRSLQACEGAILVVDATQGVQAQTLANLNLARKQNLCIIPVLNKIDLPNAQIETVSAQLVGLGFTKEEILHISAKTGLGVDKVLKRIVEVVPEPRGDSQKPLRALIFSSQYDTHKGVVVYVRIVDGSFSHSRVLPLASPSFASNSPPAADQTSEATTRAPRLAPPAQIRFMASGAENQPIEIGYFNPDMRPTEELHTGEVGYIATGLKEVALAKVGDTITLGEIPNPKSQIPGRASFVGNDVQPLPGYQEPKPMVFLGLFPIQSDEYPEVREALGKLRLSDSAFTYRPISSLALGNGFHCGFLGLLHAEVVQERLTREFNLSLFATAPSVEYLVKLKDHNSPLSASVASSPSYIKKGLGGVIQDNGFISIQSASEYPDPSQIEETKEPMMQLTIFSPKQYVGAIMQIVQDKRGEYIDLEYLGGSGTHSTSSGQAGQGESSEIEDDLLLAKFTYLMPLSEMIIDFFDQLKSVTQGYASLDYEFFDYQSVDVVKLDILVNHEKVDAFSQLVVSSRSQYLGRRMVEKLAEVIPRKQFLIPIQAAIGGTIIARADVKPFRKDVTQKLYGGDRTRKDKLLDKQKKGKAKMKQVGNVEIPQEAFLKVFSRN